MPVPTRAGSRRRPTVARNGFASVAMRSTAAPEAPQLRDPAGGDRLAAEVGALVEDAGGGHPAFLAVTEGQSVADTDRPRVQAGVGGLLPRGTASDLEDGDRDGPVRVGLGGREQAADAFDESLDALAGDG